MPTIKHLNKVLFEQIPELEALDLSDKQLLFCMEYIKDFNGLQACIRAGYKETNAYQPSSVMLSNPKIMQAISLLTVNLVEKIQEETGVTVSNVVLGIQTIIDRCMQVKPVMMKRDGVWLPTGEFTFDAANALRAYELLGKHLGMWIERKELKITTLTYEQRIMELRGPDGNNLEEIFEIEIKQKPPQLEHKGGVDVDK